MEVDHHELVSIDQAEFDSSNEVSHAEGGEDEEMSDIQTSLCEESVYSEEVDKIRSVSI